MDFIRRMEEILDAFADRVSKPRLFITDKMQIALGTFCSYNIDNFIAHWFCPMPFPASSIVFLWGIL